MTTNERLNASRYKHFHRTPRNPSWLKKSKYSSPFDRGIILNAAEFFHLRIGGIFHSSKPPRDVDWKNEFDMERWIKDEEEDLISQSDVDNVWTTSFISLECFCIINSTNQHVELDGFWVHFWNFFNWLVTARWLCYGLFCRSSAFFAFSVSRSAMSWRLSFTSYAIRDSWSKSLTFHVQIKTG